MFIINPYIFTAAGYTIEGSGLFNGTDGKLTRTISSAGNRKKWTLSGCYKRSGNASDYLLSSGQYNSTHLAAAGGLIVEDLA